MKFASSTGYVSLSWVDGGVTLGRGVYNDQLTYTLPASTIGKYITIKSVDKNRVSPRGRLISLELTEIPFISYINTLSGNKIESIETSYNPINTFNLRNTPNIKYLGAISCSLTGNINDYLVDSLTDYELGYNMLSGDINTISNKSQLNLFGVSVNKLPLNIKDIEYYLVASTLTDEIYVSGGNKLLVFGADNVYNLRRATIVNNPILTDVAFENSSAEGYYPWAPYLNPVPDPFVPGGYYIPSTPGYYYFKSLSSISIYDNPSLDFISMSRLVNYPAGVSYSVTVSGCPALSYFINDNDNLSVDIGTVVSSMDSLRIIKSSSDAMFQPGRVIVLNRQDSLRTVNISSVNDIRSLQLTLCPYITSLRVDPTSLQDLNISQNSIKGNLNEIFTTSIPASSVLEINVEKNYFTAFTPNSALEIFKGKNNAFRELTISDSPNLYYLDVSYNTKLSSLNFISKPSPGNIASMYIDVSSTALSSLSLSANNVDTILAYSSTLTSLRVVTNINNNNIITKTAPKVVACTSSGSFTSKCSSVFISGRFDYNSNISYTFGGTRMDLRQVTISSSNVMPVETSPYVKSVYSINMDSGIGFTSNAEFENFVFAFSAAPGGSIHTVYPQFNFSFNNHSLTSFIGSRCFKGLSIPKNVNLTFINGKIKTIDVSNPCYYSKLDFTSNPITDGHINLSCLSSLSAFYFGALSGRLGVCKDSQSPFLNANNNILPLSSITFPVDNRIEELTIINTKLSSINLASFKNIKRLSLAYNRDLKTIGITNLSACSALRYFNITGCGFSSAQLTNIWNQLPTIPANYIWPADYDNNSEGLWYNYNGEEVTGTGPSGSCPSYPTFTSANYGDTNIWVDKRWRKSRFYQFPTIYSNEPYWADRFAKYY
jgi:hypothetical protein